MAMDIKRNLLFFIDKEKTDTGYKPDGKLRLRIRYDKKKIDFNVGHRADLVKWNKDDQICKKGTTHGKKKVSATTINKEIQRLETLADEVFKSFEVLEHIPSIDEFRNAFNKANGKEVSNETEPDYTFFPLFDEFVKENGTNWAKETLAKISTVKNHLKSFDSKLTFEVFNESGLNGYVSHLRDVLDMRNTTIIKQINFLKWFLRWAKKKGYNNENAFEFFKPKLKSTQKKVIFLTWDELIQLKGCNIPEQKKYLDRVRDVFLFQCYTSLRYSDVFNLKRSDVKDTCIEVTTQKTADSLIIELNDNSRAILDKYEDCHFENDKALPVISNQKMNDYLKELGKLAGIDEPIRETYYKGNERHDEVMPKYALLGTHAGRRTFICHSLAMGIPAQTVMKWTGHSDYKAMKPYIDVADKDKQKAMTKWNDTQMTKDNLLERLKSIPKDELKELLKKL